MEPPKQQKRVPIAKRDPTEIKPQNRLGGYARFFPQGSWELNDPIVLDSATSKFLLKEYTTQPDGRVFVNPCTVIYLPDGDAEDADSRKRVIILQAPQGAILRFDSPVDLGRGKIGRLLGGDMHGPVTIQSGPTRPEGGDDLFVTTHDVQMQDNLIFTPSEVDFRFGASHGHGRDLRIELLPGDGDSKNKTANIGGVQSLQLLTDVQMHLQPGSGGFLPGDSNPRPGRSATQSVPLATGNSADGSNPPVDIRCQGPFEFDMVQYIATFHDRVDVVRPHPTGASDQMNGELLNVYFAPRQQSPTATKKSAPGSPPPLTSVPANAPTAVQATKQAGAATDPNAHHGMPQLEPRRLVMRGAPVVVRAESMGGEIRGERLEYDILTRHLLVQAADGQVYIDSPQLSGQVSQLEAWVRDDSAPGGASDGNSGIGGPNMGSNQQAGLRRGPVDPSSGQTPGQPRQHYEVYGRTLRVWSASHAGRNEVEHVTVEGNVHFVQTPANPGEKPLDAQGDFLEVLRANAPNAEVAVTGQPAQVGGQGLTMIGQTVHMNRGDNRVWIDGLGRMIVAGDQGAANGQRGATGVQSATAGNNAAGTNLAPSNGALFSSGHGTTTVDWQGGMNFDGRTVQFERDVVGQQVDGDTVQTIRAPHLDVTLHDRIDFNAAGPQRQRPQIELLSCRDNVWLENRQSEQGKLQSIDRMQHLATLTVNQITGEINGQVTPDQPGRLFSWRLGNSSTSALGLNGAAFSGRPAALAGGMGPTQDGKNGPAAQGRDPASEQINFLDVQFQRGITGNISPARRELTFFDQVRSVYGPVAKWDDQLDADSPTGLPASCTLLTCEQMTVNSTATPGQPRPAMQMEATGNTRVEGQGTQGDSFTAFAQRLTYAQEKDLMVLYGDGRSDAQLIRQEHPGAPQTPIAAGSIFYWPSTRQYKINDVRFINSTQFINQAPPRPAAHAPTPSAAQPAATPPRR